MAKEKKAQKPGGAVDQLIDSMRTGEAFNKREKGSAISSNAVLAAEAIEMFSKVNNRRRYTPNGMNFDPTSPRNRDSVANPNSNGESSVNPAQAALLTLRSSANQPTTPSSDKLPGPTLMSPNSGSNNGSSFNARMNHRKSVGPGVYVAMNPSPKR